MPLCLYTHSRRALPARGACRCLPESRTKVRSGLLQSANPELPSQYTRPACGCDTCTEDVQSPPRWLTNDAQHVESEQAHLRRRVNGPDWTDWQFFADWETHSSGKLTLGDPWQDSASFSLARNKACSSCATCSQFGTNSRLATLLISTVVQGVYTGVAAPPFPIAYEAVLQPCWSRHVTTATAAGYLPT